MKFLYVVKVIITYKITLIFCEKSEYSIDLKNISLYTILIQRKKGSDYNESQH